MAVDLGLPERPRGEPIVVVAVNHKAGIVAHAGGGHQLLELLLGQDVAAHGVAQLRVPGPGERAGHVPLVIGFGIDVDFHHPDVRIGGVLRDPVDAGKRFGMRVIHNSPPWMVLLRAIICANYIETPAPRRGRIMKLWFHASCAIFFRPDWRWRSPPRPRTPAPPRERHWTCFSGRSTRICGRCSRRIWPRIRISRKTN